MYICVCVCVCVYMFVVYICMFVSLGGGGVAVLVNMRGDEAHAVTWSLLTGSTKEQDNTTRSCGENMFSHNLALLHA